MFFTAIGSFCAFILLGEITSTNLRSIFSAIVNCGFNICGYIFIPIYKYSDGWRLVFQISAGFTILIAIAYYYYAEESPKFYIIKHDLKNYIDNLRRIAVKNKRAKVFDGFYDTEREKIEETFSLIMKSSNAVTDSTLTGPNVESDADIEETLKHEKLVYLLKNKKYSPLDLIRYPSQRNKFIILCLLWFLVSSNYYGITFNLKNLPGDIYLLGMIMNSVDIVAYMSGGFIADIIGRKTTILISLCVAILTFGINLIFSLSDTVTTVFSMIARASISLIYNLMCTYTLELYPTVIRSYGFGYNTLFESLGIVVIPTVIEYLGDYINLIFTFVNIFNFGIVLFLPETLNKPLPDFIPELLTQKEIIDKVITKE